MIRFAKIEDGDILSQHDRHISKEELKTSIKLNRIYIAEANRTFLGWLRYNMFWDNTPFMNMLFVLDNYRNQGVGKALVQFWEEEMKNRKFGMVMTSTAANESAQHFYYRMGYKTVGGFLPENEPYELILSKYV